MKRYSLVVFLGLTLMLLALAPQLRADGCDHFNYTEHGNTLASSQDSVVTHSNAWRDNDDHRHSFAGSGMCWNGGSGSGSDPESGSGSQDASTPEPSSLFLLVSSLLAAAVGMALKKAAV